MKPYIRLDQLKSEGRRLSYQFSSSLNVFNKKTCFIEYEQAFRVSRASIDAIPFAALMAPVAWATGADLILPELDANFAESLLRCKKHYIKWFSKKWSFKTEIKTAYIRNTQTPTRHALLFSGGLDSLTTYIRHKDKRPLLFSVMGADIPLANASFISLYKKMCDGFAREEGLAVSYIHTDMRDVLNQEQLNRYSSNWYGDVSHGLMLASLVAPITSHSVKTLLLASCSHRPGCSYTCGSAKDLVQEIHWAGTAVENDNYELNRSEKIRAYLKKNPRYQNRLRVCWAQFHSLNCGECEKCLRTICELLINGIDPALCNFRINDETLPNLKKRLLKRFHHFIRGESALDYWRTIQEEIEAGCIKDQYGAPKFFAWLAGYEKISKRQSPLATRYFSQRVKLEVFASRHLKPSKLFSFSPARKPLTPMLKVTQRNL